MICGEILDKSFCFAQKFLSMASSSALPIKLLNLSLAISTKLSLTLHLYIARILHSLRCQSRVCIFGRTWPFWNRLPNLAQHPALLALQLDDKFMANSFSLRFFYLLFLKDYRTMFVRLAVFSELGCDFLQKKGIGATTVWGTQGSSRWSKN